LDKIYARTAAILFLAIFVVSAVAIPFTYSFTSSVTPKNANYVQVEGVASTDYFSSQQYSYKVNEWAWQNGVWNDSFMSTATLSGSAAYATVAPDPNGYTPLGPLFTPGDIWYNASKSLRIGMTEYGEFATYNTTDRYGHAQNTAGIAYGFNNAEWLNTESWANPAIATQYWIQGWLFYINYTSFTAAAPRCVEAYAIFSNGTKTEEGRRVWSWDGTMNPGAAGSGLAQGTLTPSGVEVLYDSARLFVAKACVTITDAFTNYPFAKVTLTLVYNKDTKYAIVYKDLKILCDTKELQGINQLCFSERYEIDMCRTINTGNKAYIHYFDYNQEYDSNMSWITTHWIKDEMGLDSVYQHPLLGTDHYDVLQAFDPGRRYIFFAGYWPNATAYDMYADFIPNLQVNKTSVLPIGWKQPDINASAVSEAATPKVDVEWNYAYNFSMGTGTDPINNMLDFLTKADNREIRFVEVFGMTDYHHQVETPTELMNVQALDANASDSDHNWFWDFGPINQLDTEVCYIMGQVFRPEDVNGLTSSDYLHMASEPYFDYENAPLMWVGIGQTSLPVDSAGAAYISPMGLGGKYSAALLFDKYDNSPFGPGGAIPYANIQFSPNYYYQTFNNYDWGKGLDKTVYSRTELINFAFGTYDDSSILNNPPQPIEAGFAGTNSSVVDGSTTYTFQWWYPTKDPLTERWLFWGGDIYNHTAYYYSTSETMYNMSDPPIMRDPNGIATLGGFKANQISRYFNDFYFLISRETDPNTLSQYALVSGGTTTGTAPTSNQYLWTLDYFPISTWASSKTLGYSFNYLDPNTGYAILALGRDVNGLRGLEIAGWNGRDTYWASAWASQFLFGDKGGHWPSGTVAIMLQITYSGTNGEPTLFTVLKVLGTITEMGYNEFTGDPGWLGGFYVGNNPPWYQDLPSWFISSDPTDPSYPWHFDAPCNYGHVWWFAKLPTITTASVEFDQ
jgi:hypothetical protein